MTEHARDMRELAQPLDSMADLDPLLERIGDAQYVLIGEASHGTSEYYRWRAALTRRLVEEKGFAFVAVEGDWPDCFRVHCSVTGASGETPRAALEAFRRWPTWMWANEEVVEFCTWLRGHNADRPRATPVGFHGLDVYSLWDSLRALLGYLREHEPDHVEAALSAVRCFEPYGEDPQEYASATRFAPESCEAPVVRLLVDLRRQVAQDGGGDDETAAFAARQNAEVAAGAERYYRAMVCGGGASWNVRDHHMADTLDRLVVHYGDGAKAVVWEHNTHVGDARATDMADRGLVNVGQLVRERHGDDAVVLVGSGSHRGSVVAGDAWGADMQAMPVPPARAGSLEDQLHEAGLTRALFVHPPAADQPAWLADALDHRAIGVVYRPEAERFGNYVSTVLGRRYDAFLWFDEAQALHALHAPAAGRELEAFPSGE
jgi:erythromycin esterase-like protein